MKLLVILLIIIIIFLFVVLYILKRQIKDMLMQIKETNITKSNNNISISLINKDIIELAAEINKNIDYQNELRRGVVNNERELKDSIANISHDLRTPLTSIIGYIQLLEKSELTENQDKNLKIIYKKSYELKNLVTDFFELSLLESDETLPCFIRINICNLISDIVIENVEILEKANLSLEFNIPNDPLFIYADEIMIRRIMQNLISNAIRYSNKDLIVTLEQKDKIQINVRNSIDNAKDVNSEKLFDRFYKGDESRSGKGTGLGLAIVKLLVEKMNGTICAKVVKDYLEIIIEFELVKL